MFQKDQHVALIVSKYSVIIFTSLQKRLIKRAARLSADKDHDLPAATNERPKNSAILVVNASPRWVGE